MLEGERMDQDAYPRVLQVTVDGQKRIVLCGENKCSICTGTMEVESEADAIDFHIDGHLACATCRAALVGNFQSLYCVCFNVLCRKKWKQLTARIVPFFCPSCRKQLEMKLKPLVDGNPQANELNELDYLYALHHYWSRVMEQLSRLLVFEWASAILPPPCPLGKVDSTTIPHLHPNAAPLQDTLASIRDSFQALTIDVARCRNWNSMLMRKKYYRGYVLSKDLVSSVCECVAERELTKDFQDLPLTKVPGKFLPNGQKCLRHKHLVLDWKDELRSWQPIYFISFPNPVGDKKCQDYIVNITKIVSGPIKSEPRIDCDDSQTRRVPCPLLMEPSKITSPFSGNLDAATAKSPLTMMATPSPGASWLKTSGTLSPSTPWKVMHRMQPLWNHTGSLELTTQESPPPPGLELPCSDAPLGVSGFGDLMQWSDAVRENNVDTENSQWYAPLNMAKSHLPCEFGDRGKKQGSSGIRSVPEDSEVHASYALPLHMVDNRTTVQPHRRSLVPQSPFAVYYGD